MAFHKDLFLVHIEALGFISQERRSRNSKACPSVFQSEPEFSLRFRHGNQLAFAPVALAQLETFLRMSFVGVALEIKLVDGTRFVGKFRQGDAQRGELIFDEVYAAGSSVVIPMITFSQNQISTLNQFEGSIEDFKRPAEAPKAATQPQQTQQQLSSASQRNEYAPATDFDFEAQQEKLIQWKAEVRPMVSVHRPCLIMIFRRQHARPNLLATLAHRAHQLTNQKTFSTISAPL